MLELAAPIAVCAYTYGGLMNLCRFKEHLLWHVDAGGYYSSPTAKYLEFGNEQLRLSKETERQALKAAFKLGHALGRIVILPEFRCTHCVDCTAGTIATPLYCLLECVLDTTFNIFMNNKITHKTSA